MNLREIRKAKGVTQVQAARDLNISQITYNRYENGQREVPNIVLVSMADYFGITVDELLGRTSPEQKKAQEDEAESIRERLRRDPAYRLLFSAADKATPEHLRSAAAMLKALEPEEENAD